MSHQIRHSNYSMEDSEEGIKVLLIIFKENTIEFIEELAVLVIFFTSF